MLGFVEEPGALNEPDDAEAFLVDPTGHHPSLLFLRVPESKTIKNRVHIDLTPGVLREEEVSRLLDLGATLVDDRRRPDGSGWAVLADPEGNEFCVERSRAEFPDHVAPTHAPPLQQPPDELVLDDRAALASMLELQRARVVAKVAGLADHHAVARPWGSPTSIAGLVTHLALVDDSWFAEDLADEAPADWYAGVDFDTDPDWEFRTALDEPLALQVERYEEACRRARTLAGAVTDLDKRVTPGGADRRHRHEPPSRSAGSTST